MGFESKWVEIFLRVGVAFFSSCAALSIGFDGDDGQLWNERIDVTSRMRERVLENKQSLWIGLVRVTECERAYV